MGVPEMPEHISKQFDAELEAVRSRVLQMGGLVEEQIVKALDGLSSGDLQALDRVIDDDHRVNAMEVGLDESCSQIIARRQPAAGDLRLVMAVIKTITDLERVGDEAEKIARMAKLIHGAGQMQLPRLELKQVRGVDDEFRSILRQLITFMMEDPRTITRCLEILFVAKAIERIGDHAKNMAEYVVYMVEGRDVRHTRGESHIEGL